MSTPESLTFSDIYPAIRGVSLLTDAKLRALWDAAQAVEAIPGDVAELGVFCGGASRLFAKACPTRTVHLFDTFAGLPSEGHDAKHDFHQPGEFASNLADVRKYLADCPNVEFHPGLFPDTATGETFALVHLDADLYGSTKAGLEWFWPRLSLGGRIIADDWRWANCPGVEAAVRGFFVGKENWQFRESAPHQLTITKCSGI